jgi:hypothetical protein
MHSVVGHSSGSGNSAASQLRWVRPPFPHHLAGFVEQSFEGFDRNRRLQPNRHWTQTTSSTSQGPSR